MIAVIVPDIRMDTLEGLSVQSVPVLPLCDSLWDLQSLKTEASLMITMTSQKKKKKRKMNENSVCFFFSLQNTSMVGLQGSYTRRGMTYYMTWQL